MAHFLSHRLRSRLSIATVVIAPAALMPVGLAPLGSADDALIRITRSDSTSRLVVDAGRQKVDAGREKDGARQADNANDRRKRALIASVLILGSAGHLPFGSFK